MNPEFAKSKLNEATHAKDQARRTAWLMLVMGLLVIVTLGIALVDYWWLLPRGVRWGGFGVLALLMAAGFVRLISLLRRPASLKEVALDVEARDPSLGCTISTAAEYLSGERKILHEYEPGLVKALETQAAGLLVPVKLPYWQRMLLPGLLCLVGLIIFAGFLLSSSGALTALRRAAVPWSSAAYTRVEVKPGPVEIPVGSDLEIQGLFHGRIPKEPRVEWRQNGQTAWQTLALLKKDTLTHTNLLKDLRQAASYRVAGGDAISPEYRIETYVPPEIKDLRVRLDYPAYTRMPATSQAHPDLKALRGTTATFALVPNTPLASARLVSEQGLRVDLTPGSNGVWQGALTLAKNTPYRIELRDLKGRPELRARTNHIEVLLDAPPKVEIEEPGQDMRADATNTIPIKISVTDDYGVGEIALVCHKLGGPERVLPATQVRREGKETIATVDLPLTPLGLKDYEVVAYYAQAKDNNTLDGPGIGKSSLYYVEITNKEGGKPKPKGKNPPPPQVNLLVVQKQIIADTRALDKSAAKESYNELAQREKDASDFGQLYFQAMGQAGAPPEAVSLMESAMKDLNTATTTLQKQNRDGALLPEEQALAKFYQILKLLPELQEMPLKPPPPNLARTNAPPTNSIVNVVLSAISKKKKESIDTQELAEMMEQAEALSQAQTSINHLMQASAKTPAAAAAQMTGRQADGGKPGEDEASSSEEKNNPDSKDKADQQNASAAEKNGSDKNAQSGQNKASQGQKNAGSKGEKSGQGKGEKGQGEKGQGDKGQGDQAGQEGEKGQGDQGDAGKEGNGKQGQDGKGKGEKGKGQDGKGKGQDGKGKGGKGGKGQGGEPGEADGLAKEGQDGQPDDKEKSEDLAQQQEKLSEEAAELAEKLARVSGKDARLGHNIAKPMNSAVNNMKRAAQGVKAGDRVGSSTLGTQAAYDLNRVAAMLQKILEAEGQLGDVSNEDYPIEYEAAIRDYLKRLSYQE